MGHGVSPIGAKVLRCSECMGDESDSGVTPPFPLHIAACRRDECLALTARPLLVITPGRAN